MKFNILSLMPEMIEQSLNYGVVGAAFKKNLCELQCLNPRRFTEDVHQSVDDRPFGGGDGMLMMAEPLQKSLEHLSPEGPVFFLSPQGQVFDDAMAKDLAQQKEITLICGRYGGVDQRFLNKNKIVEISLGDFVLSGGEVAALAIVDAVTRQLPQVLGHSASAVEDSFKNGLLEVPHFTRPQKWGELQVPPLLLSGDHKKISQYKMNMGLVITLHKRPDLLGQKPFNWAATLAFVEKLGEENIQPLGLTKGEAQRLLKEKLK